MPLSGKLYDILKWTTLIGIPALTTAYVGLANIWMFPYPTQVAETSAVICTLLGALIGVSSTQYYKGDKLNTENS